MTTLTEESSAVCAQCQMRLTSWAEPHPLEACVLHEAGMSPGFIRFLWSRGWLVGGVPAVSQ